MFVFPRSAVAVILPLALLVAVVLWSNRAQPGMLSGDPVARSQDARDGQAVAANLPSR